MATQRGGGGDWKECARADAPQRARIVLLRWERLAESGQDEVELAVGKQLILDGLTIALEAGGLQTCVVEELPNCACRATVCPSEEEQLQGALIHPSEEHRSPTSAAIEKLETRKRVALAASNVDSIEGSTMRRTLRHPVGKKQEWFM